MSKSAQGQRGKAAEAQVQAVLGDLNRQYAAFDWGRIYDTRSARNFLPKQPGDYEFYYPGVHGLIEVKEVKHDYRLPKARLEQLPMLRKRALAGGLIIVAVFHTATGVWRRPPLKWLVERCDLPSWDMSDVPVLADAGQVLAPIEQALAANAEHRAR